jgi:glucose dehydrogenase
MKHEKLPLFATSCLILRLALVQFVSLAPLSGQVLTRSYNNQRTGANTGETSLTPANVANLKKLRELPVDAGDDPRIEAQPQFVPKLQMADEPHDVVIVCTMANNVYAFDANTGAKLWKTNLGTRSRRKSREKPSMD